MGDNERTQTPDTERRSGPVPREGGPTPRSDEVAALRRSLRNAEALLEIAPAFFGFLSLEGIVLDVNQLALNVIEATREQVVGQFFWEAAWWKPVRRSAVSVQEAVREAASGTEARLEIEYWSIREGNGQKRWVDLIIRPVRDNEGSIARLAATGVDITEHQDAKEALRRSEDRLWESVEKAAVTNKALEDAQREADYARTRLMELFRNAPFFVCVLQGPEHIYEMVNPLYQKIRGEERRLLGQSVIDVVPEAAEQGLIELLDRVYKTGEPFIGYEKLIRVDRQSNGVVEDAFITFVYQPRLGAAKNVEGIDVFGFDVTDNVRARREAQASSEANRALAEAIPQQVWTASPDGALDFVNARVLEYFNASKEQILGDGWQTVIHPEDLPACIARWAHALKTGEGYEIEFRLRRSDGSYRWHLGRAAPLRDDTGRIRKWFGTNTDIDDAKRHAGR